MNAESGSDGRAGKTGVCDGCGADLRNLALDDGCCPGCGEPVLPVDPREVTQDTEGLALAGRIEPNPLRRTVAGLEEDAFGQYDDSVTRTGRAPNPDGRSWRAEDEQ